MDIPILFEDEALVCINKPPGLVVNRAHSVKVETVQDWVDHRYGVTPTDGTQELDEFVSRSGIVHRIDKETSGILLIAKTSDVFQRLKQQFMDRTVHKTYLALVHDTLPSTQGEIDAPIDRLPWNKELFGVVPDGKASVTTYSVLHTYARQVKKIKEYHQLVECFPKTGRTHQIRVHLKYLGHPIVGDYLYAGRKTARDDRTWVPRVMLHAYKISFTHPITNQLQSIVAAIPEDMQQTIDQLTKL